MLILVSCSSPRYTYNFDYYDYNSGRKGPSDISSSDLQYADDSPLKVDGNEVIAAAEAKTKNDLDVNSSPETKTFKSNTTPYQELSKAERKELRRELKNYIKNYSKQARSGDEVANVNATNQLDDDLKLAIIFGAIGITFAILGGINTVFWVIGVIGLIVGLVFFIRWISTQ